MIATIETIVNNLAREGIEGLISLPEAAKQITSTVNSTRVSYKEDKKCTIFNHSYVVDLKLKGLGKKDKKTAQELVILLDFYTNNNLKDSKEKYNPKLNGIEFHGSNNGIVISTKHYRKNFDNYSKGVLAKYNLN